MQIENVKYEITDFMVLKQSDGEIKKKKKEVKFKQKTQGISCRMCTDP